MIFLTLTEWTMLGMDFLGVSGRWYSLSPRIRIVLLLSTCGVASLLLAGVMSYRQWTGRNSKVDRYVFLALLAAFFIGTILVLVVEGPK